MKKLLLIISFFCWSSICFSQEKTANIQIFTSEFERIEIVRLRSGMDLLEGLKEAVNSRKIKNGVILAGIGAVTDYHYHVVSSKNLPPDEEYPKASVPMDLISVQGYILNGRVHAHIALSDANSVVGGHLESGTKALTFFIITIGVLPDSLKIDNLDNYKY
ncbi:MAG TPA: DNA-binding protein [Candidatus Marinimicrobia bacterium]|jgi:predicted DNA-binding protein with PD1-like motif|nr:DNA-binding protein [Candidatus Neomarinimicrobiota bacterium]